MDHPTLDDLKKLFLATERRLTWYKIYTICLVMMLWIISTSANVIYFYKTKDYWAYLIFFILSSVCSVFLILFLISALNEDELSTRQRIKEEWNV